MKAKKFIIFIQTQAGTLIGQEHEVVIILWWRRRIDMERYDHYTDKFVGTPSQTWMPFYDVGTSTLPIYRKLEPIQKDANDLILEEVREIKRLLEKLVKEE